LFSIPVLSNSEKFAWATFSELLDQCEDARRSRIVFTRASALHSIPRARLAAQPWLGNRTVRNIMQHGLTCGEDQALPGLVTLSRPPEKVARDFFR
jgi:hypothetical protein